MLNYDKSFHGSEIYFHSSKEADTSRVSSCLSATPMTMTWNDSKRVTLACKRINVQRIGVHICIGGCNASDAAALKPNTSRFNGGTNTGWTSLSHRSRPLLSSFHRFRKLTSFRASTQHPMYVRTYVHFGITCGVSSSTFEIESKAISRGTVTNPCDRWCRMPGDGNRIWNAAGSCSIRSCKLSDFLRRGDPCIHTRIRFALTLRRLVFVVDSKVFLNLRSFFFF